MRKFWLVVFLIAVLGCYGQDAPIPNVVKPPAAVSREDAKKIIEHIQRLAKQQQVELEQVKIDNGEIKTQLAAAQDAHSAAQFNAIVLQGEVDKVTDDRNKQAAAKDSALTLVEEQKIQIVKKDKQIGFLKRIIAFEVAASVAFLMLWLRIPRICSPYGLIATIIFPGISFGIVWLLL